MSDNRIHIPETDLALFVSGDLSLARRIAVGLHVRGCERCRKRADAYRADRKIAREIAGELPPGVDWDRLAAEMSANIHLGLAAGECVARVPRRRVARVSWRPAAIAAGAVVLLTVAWFMNMPAGTSNELERAMNALVHGRVNSPGVASGEQGAVVVATPMGIELRENDSVIGGSQDAPPLAVSATMQGSASASYVNADTGQMTITSVYVQ